VDCRIRQEPTPRLWMPVPAGRNSKKIPSVTYRLTIIGGPGISILLQTQPLAGPNATLSSTSLLFVCRNVINAGCQCITQRTLTLSNYGNQTLNIDGITITGPFSQGNNCGTSLKAGRFCSISVTWLEPQGSGSGTLAVRDNASGSPQMVSLGAYKQCTPIARSNTANDVPCYSTNGELANATQVH
jgi:hypothetical protein